MTLYAIGDIHGRFDLLRRINRLVFNDIDLCRPDAFRIVFLGDYVDKGPDSSGVVACLAALRAASDGRVVCLRGNHEQALLDFLDRPAGGRAWLLQGGLATLASYGVREAVDPDSGEALSALAQELATRMPADHVEFLRTLPTSVEEDEYFFVHAGVRPGVSLGNQSDLDLMTIRRDFLDHTARWEKTIVHGHSVTEAPFADARRIGVDTGAYATGRLSGVKLQGRRRSFFTVSAFG